MILSKTSTVSFFIKRDIDISQQKSYMFNVYCKLYSGKNYGKISGKFCMFPEVFPFFSQNGRIIRPFWERNGNILGSIQHFLAISPSVFIHWLWGKKRVYLFLVLRAYKPYSWRKNLGIYPIKSIASFLFSFLKVGIPPLKINIFQRFKYRYNRAESTFSKTRQCFLKGITQDFSFVHITVQYVLTRNWCPLMWR